MGEIRVLGKAGHAGLFVFLSCGKSLNCLSIYKTQPSYYRKEFPSLEHLCKKSFKKEKKQNYLDILLVTKK